MSASVELEDSPDVRQRLDEPVDLLARVVDGQARSRRRGNAQAVHQDLRAVVAGADADRMPVEDLGDVVAVYALELERDDPGTVVADRRAEHAQPGHLAPALERVGGELRPVRVSRIEADRVEPLDGSRQADRLAASRGAALGLGGSISPAELAA